MTVLHDLDTVEAPPRGTLHLLLGSLGTALAHPSTWLLGWLLVTVPALLALATPWAHTDTALSQHPGATFLLDPSLDADLARHAPATAIPTVGAAVFVFVAFAWLSGAVLACVGRMHGFRLRDLLAEGGRLLPRNLRVLFVAAIGALLLAWGLDALDHWVRESWLYDVDPSATLLDTGWRWLSLDAGLEALGYAYGLLFLGLAYVTKLAMARLALTDATGALWAWLAALGHALRHPLRSGIVVTAFAALWLVAGLGTGALTTWALEGEQSLALGLVCGQLGVLTAQVLIVATLLAARGSMASSLVALPEPHEDYETYPPDYFEEEP